MTTRAVASPKQSARGGRSRFPQFALALLGLTASAVLLAACGVVPASQVAQLGTTTTTTPAGPSATAASKYGQALDYSRCMRSHGVPNYPDPKEVGGAVQISGTGSGMNPDSPTYRSAQQSCRPLLPGGGESTTSEQQHALAQTLQLSTCMRAHGIEAFPDPTLSPPSSRAGYSSVMSRDGVWLAIPNSIDERSPGFERASVACNLSGTS